MEQLEYELAELQNLESCLAQGFTLEDVVECKKALIEQLKAASK